MNIIKSIETNEYKLELTESYDGEYFVILFNTDGEIIKYRNSKELTQALFSFDTILNSFNDGSDECLN